MVALNTSTHRLLAAPAGGKLGDAVPLDMRVAMERMLADLGFSAFIVSNTAPVDKTALWWHKDIKTPKRYDAYNSVWSALAPGQYALHLMQRAVVATNVETAVAADDMFMFYDVSRGEMMKIGRVELAQALMPGQMRLLDRKTASAVNYVDLVLPGPFSMVMWAMTFTVTGEHAGPWAHIAETNSFPAASGAGPGASPFAIAMSKPNGASTFETINGKHVGAGMLFYNGLSIHHRPDYTADFENQYFSRPSLGQNRYMRVYCFASRTPGSIATSQFNSVDIDVWGC